MIIFKDILTGDEMISDSFDPKEIDGVLYEVDAKKITIGADAINIGANPSAEEGDEGVDDGAQVVFDVVHSFRLQETSFDKKSYLTYLKGYMKKIDAKLEEDGVSEPERKAFKAGAQAAALKIAGSFKDKGYQFFIGESMDPEGMVALLSWRDDEVTPYFTFWKHGLKGEKV